MNWRKEINCTYFAYYQCGAGRLCNSYLSFKININLHSGQITFCMSTKKRDVNKIRKILLILIVISGTQLECEN